MDGALPFQTVATEEDGDALVASSSSSSSSSMALTVGGQGGGGGGGGGGSGGWHSTVEYVRTGQPLFSPDTTTVAAATTTAATTATTTATTITSSIATTTVTAATTTATTLSSMNMESFELTVRLRRLDTGQGPGKRANAQEHGPGKRAGGGGRESVQVYCPKYHRGKVASYFLVVAVAIVADSHSHNYSHSHSDSDSHKSSVVDDKDLGQNGTPTATSTATMDQWEIAAVKKINTLPVDDRCLETTGTLIHYSTPIQLYTRIAVHPYIPPIVFST